MPFTGQVIFLNLSSQICLKNNGIDSLSFLYLSFPYLKPKWCLSHYFFFWRTNNNNLAPGFIFKAFDISGYIEIKIWPGEWHVYWECAVLDMTKFIIISGNLSNKRIFFIILKEYLRRGKYRIIKIKEGTHE